MTESLMKLATFSSVIKRCMSESREKRKTESLLLILWKS